MSATKAACELTMGPGVVHMITSIIGACVMTNPNLAVDVRRIGVTILITEIAIWLNRMGSCL